MFVFKYHKPHFSCQIDAAEIMNSTLYYDGQRLLGGNVLMQ